MYLKLATVFACFLNTNVLGLPTGAPIVACSSMRPEHGLNHPQPSENSPYFVKAMADPNQNNRVLGKC